MATDFRCTFCWNPATELCGRCKLVRYCGRGCQKNDWRTHKVFCGGNTYPTKDGETQSYRGILFAVDEEKPRFIELPAERERADDENAPVSMMPTITRLLGGGGRMSLRRQGVENRARELVRGQLVLHRQPFGAQRAHNLALRKFMGLGKEFDIMGPVVFTKVKKSVERNNGVDEFMDIEVDDLKDMVDFLRYQMTLAVTQKRMGVFPGP